MLFFINSYSCTQINGFAASFIYLPVITLWEYLYLRHETGFGVSAVWCLLGAIFRCYCFMVLRVFSVILQLCAALKVFAGNYIFSICFISFAVLYRKQRCLLRYRLLSMAAPVMRSGLTWLPKNVIPTRWPKICSVIDSDMKDNYSWWTSDLHPEDTKHVVECMDVPYLEMAACCGGRIPLPLLWRAL